MFVLKRHILTELKSGNIDKVKALAWLKKLDTTETQDCEGLLKNQALDSRAAYYEIPLSGKESFLTDHKVFDEKILPGVVYLDIAYTTSIHFFSALGRESSHVVMKDIAFLSPLKVKDGVSLVASLSLFPSNVSESGHQDDVCEFKIISYQEGTEVLHVQGEVQLLSTVAKDNYIDIHTIRQGATHKIPASRLYQVFSNMGIEYGPAHESVTDITVTKNGKCGAVAKLSLPSCVANNAYGMKLHPSILDGALQVAIASDIDAFSSPQHPIVPFSLTQATVYAPLIKSEYFVVVTQRESVNDAQNQRIYDFIVCDDEGKVCIEMYGFYARQLVDKANSHKKTLEGNNSLTSGSLIFSPDWEKIELTQNIDNEMDAKARESVLSDVLIIGGSEEQVRHIKTSSPYVSSMSLTISDALDVETLARSLKSFSNTPHIIWFVEKSAPKRHFEHIVPSQDKGVLFGLDLVKTLLRLSFDAKNTALTVVTRQAVTIDSEEHIDPTHSALQGFLGSLAKEYDHWRVRHIDLGRNDALPMKEISRLPKNIAFTAYRSGDWFCPAHVVTNFDDWNSPSAFKQGGVYILFGGAGGVGELFSEYLITHYQAQVIWVGRRELNGELQQKIDRLAALGVKPDYYAVDASSESDIRALVKQVNAAHQEIHGVIHTAMVLNDGAIANMDREKFRSSLSPKLDLSLNLVKVFSNESLDFMLFFSSLQSSFCAAGQSNYAAGSTFIDTFASAAKASAPYPIKVVNWGFWGNVGIVASDFYRSRMRSIGIADINPEMAMRVLECLLSSDIDRLAYIETLSEDIALSINVSNRKFLRVMPPSKQENTQFTTIDKNGFPGFLSEYEQGIQKLNTAISEVLLAQILSSDVVSQDGTQIVINPVDDESLDNWLKQSLIYLAQNNLLHKEENGFCVSEKFLNIRAGVWKKWSATKKLITEGEGLYQGVEAKLRLVDATLKSIPDLLNGSKTPVQVIFPNGGISLVEDLYKNNAISDFFNNALAEKLKEALLHRVHLNKKKVRILEIGAGSGGTSEKIFDALDGLGDAIEEYRYTDISQVFLQHAKEKYGKNFDYIRCSIFDVSTPNKAHELALGSYDFVVATNVLHACQDVREAICNAKSLLKPGGLIFINEAVASDIYLHCTFGLLEGWWLFQDKSLRLPGGPIVSAESWQDILKKEGFNNTLLPLESHTSFQQQVIIASSNGVFREWVHPTEGRSDTNNEPVNYSVEHKETKKTRKDVETIKPSVNGSAVPEFDSKAAKRAVLNQIANVIAQTVSVDVEDIVFSEPFSSLGVDSILIVKITNKLREYFSNVDSSLLFEHNTVESLSEYFLTHDKAAIQNILPQKLERPDHKKERSGDDAKTAFDTIVDLMRTSISDVLKIDKDDIGLDQALESFGMDSILIVKLSNTLKQKIPGFDSALLFEYKDIRSLVLFLCQDKRVLNSVTPKQDEQARLENIETSTVSSVDLENKGSKSSVKSESQSREDIAIIGVSGRYPKANNLKAFWENLSEGKNCIDVVPESRWHWEQFFSKKEDVANHISEGIYTKWGGFIDNPEAFDALFFGISPREAEKIDPQERVFLECAYATIEDAGYTPSVLASASTGVFVGVMNNTYQRQPSHWSVANRVSYSFDFSGPSFAVDTACSSSLTAIHVACNSIRSGESEYAIAGGVNLIVDAEHFKGLTEMQMLSESDQCRSFGAGADGFVDGEGVGSVLLKPLSRAIQDSDQIYAVIRGSSINHGGKTNGYTVPSPGAQRAVIEKALKTSGVKPHELSYMEAHGTGTELGDPIEFSGLTRAFRQETDALGFCALGSVKSNIGHCESAAGIAGLTKILLQMKHKTLVPSLHSQQANPNLNVEDSPFFIPQTLAPWKPHSVGGNTSDNEKLIAGVSSFGAGGANAHIIVESFVPEASISGEDRGEGNDEDRGGFRNQDVICVFSAKTEEALNRRLNDFLVYLGDAPESLTSIAFSLQVGKEAFAYRFSCVVSTVEELKETIRLCLSRSAENTGGDKAYYNKVPKKSNRLEAGFDEEEKEYIVERYLEKRDLHKLAKLWSQGCSIAWEALYDNLPKRVSLPTYPFDKECYWKPIKFSRQPLSSGSSHVPSFSSNEENTKIPPSLSSQVLAYREISVQKNMPSQVSPASKPSQFKRPQLLVYLVNNQYENVIASVLGENFQNIVFIYDQPSEALAQTLRTSKLDPNVDTSVLYLCLLDGQDLSQGSLSVLNFIQALHQAGFSRAEILLGAAPRNALDQAYAESLGALNRSVSAVKPTYSVRVLVADSDLANFTSENAVVAWLERIGAELGGDAPASIHYRNAKRYSNALEPMTIDSEKHSAIKSGGTYFITGGLGGIAYSVCQYLAECYQAKLILCGRSYLEENKQRQLDELRRLGADVFYFCADVSDLKAMRRGVDDAIRSFGVIDGVFHSAGVSHEQNIFEKTSAQIAQVIAPKISGALVLDELLSDQPLDFVLYFSSVSALLGDLGACDYALANRFLLSYAEQREARRIRGEVQGKSYAVAWPLMTAGGMRDASGASSQLYLSSTGQEALDEKDCMAVLEAVLCGSDSKVFVFNGEENKISSFLSSFLKTSASNRANSDIKATDIEANVIPLDQVPNKHVNVVDRPELSGLSLRDSVVWDLKETVSQILKINRARIDIDENLSDFGFDSITLMTFSKHLSERLNTDITPAIFFSHPTLSDLAEHFESRYSTTLKNMYQAPVEPVEKAVSSKDSATNIEISNQSSETTAASQLSPQPQQPQHRKPSDDIAVIGISGRFPDAWDKEEMWQGLLSGKDSVAEIPKDRFDWQKIFGDPVKERGKTNGKWLGALPGVDEFDPRFFEISPAEAEQMDPRQRLLLQESWRALEDAGYGKHQLESGALGVFVGVEQGDYQSLVKDAPLTANHDGILASRLAYLMDLSGPALAINTACSSGLVAAHEACMSLKNGECDTAIAAGVNILLLPEAFVAMGQAGMLSENGKCQAFSENANGMVPGEAVVAVVLKPLSAAERDGDPIYGVIRGSGINYDGKTNGITAPSGKAQTQLLEKVYDKYAIDPAKIEYIVTHGTGTRLGDPVEINALYDFFRSRDVDGNAANCALTSCKSNLGHTFAASGLVNLVNVLLAMKHETIPASLHCEQESHYIPWENSPFYVNKKNTPWKKKGEPRLGALSAFGMSGTNAHMVVQSYDQQESRYPVAHQPYYLIALSGKSVYSLQQRAKDLQAFLTQDRDEETHLLALSYTLLQGRQHFSHRAALVVTSIDNAIHALMTLINGEASPNIFSGEVDRQFSEQKGLVRYGNEQLSVIAEDNPSTTKQESILALADLYCQGYSLAWENMFKNEKIVRINLPAYPFAKERYWVDQGDRDSHLLTGNSQAALVTNLHPLVQQNTSVLGLSRYRSSFTGNEFFFNQHVIHGDKILPGVAQIEMAITAAKFAIDDMGEKDENALPALSLEKLTFLNPLKIEKSNSGAVLVDIVLTPIDDSEVHFEISSQTRSESPTLHSHGTILIGSENKDVTKTSLDEIESLAAACDAEVTGEACYALFSSLGLEYGKRFRAIDNIVVHEGKAETPYLISQLTLPEELSESTEKFTLDPGFMDGVLQSCIGFFLARSPSVDAAQVPFAIESFTAYGKLDPATPVYVVVYQRSKTGDAVQKYDFEVISLEGKALIEISGFSARRLVAASASTKTNEERVGANKKSDQAELRHQSSWQECLSPRWREKAIVSGQQTSFESDRHIIFTGKNLASSEILEAFFARSKASEEVLVLASDAVNIDDHFTDIAIQLLTALQSISSASNERKRVVQLVVSDQDPFLHSSFCLALSAMLKSFELENRHISAQILDFDHLNDPAFIRDALDSEFHGGALDTEVRYRGSERYVSVLAPINLAKEKATPWVDDGVYLITGGMGGIGKILLHEITMQVSRAKIILLGRASANEAVLNELKRSLGDRFDEGIVIEYFATDVGDKAALKNCIEQINKKHGPITSVLHCAGVNHDNLLKNKSEDELRKVFHTKVSGLVALDELTQDQPLDHFVAFSSLSAVHGNVGQIDYACANAFMDAFIHARQKRVVEGMRVGRSISINWPLWREGGMRVDESTLKYLESSTGMVAISSEDAMRVMSSTLASQESQVVVHSFGGTAISQEKVASKEADMLLSDSASENSTEQQNKTGEMDVPTKNLLLEKVREALVKHISQQLKVNVNDIDHRAEFSEFGFDSVSLTVFGNTLNEEYGLELSPTVFFEFPTVNLLADFLVEEYAELLGKAFSISAEPVSISREPVAPQSQDVNIGKVATSADAIRPTASTASARVKRTPFKLSDIRHDDKSYRKEDIAIIGVSGKFPEANDVEEFWENLQDGRDCITEIPDERWNWSKLYGDSSRETNKTSVKHAGVISGIDAFDPRFFGMSPLEAESLDPQQRLLMMHVWKAIEDSGHSPESLAGANIGIFIGTGNSGYGNLTLAAGVPIEAYSAASMAGSVGPNRMSFMLDFHGPSEPIETACSSSLVAVHRAVTAIHAGQCEQAIVGGVNLLVSPEAHISFDKAGMLSPDGRCKTFSQGANGYVRGEGVGIFMLKPLAKAEQDGDQIYAVIKGTAENHGGKANSLTSPNPRAQADLIKSAIRSSGIDPSTIGYIEAHGTGTPLGDPIEIQGLKSAFKELSDELDIRYTNGSCRLGTVKTNIGHLELAAGAAGLMKVLLQLKHKTLVPSLHCDELNPYIELTNSPFSLVKEKEAWGVTTDSSGKELPRRAGISSFGFGGVNAHIILEEYLPSKAAVEPKLNGPYVMVLSAKTETALKGQIQQLSDFISAEDELDLQDVAYTLQLGRDAMEHRWSCVVNTLAELRELLEKSLSDTGFPDNVYCGSVKDNREWSELFVNDDDLSEASKLWLDKGKYEKISKFWVKGVPIDWQSLYQNIPNQYKPKRMTLPSYPFDLKSYWVNCLADVAGETASYSSVPRNISPLLSENTSTLTSQSFISRFSCKDCFVADHQVKGKGVLPGAAYVEIIHEAMVRSAKVEAGQNILIENITFLQPFLLEDSGVGDLLTELFPIEEGGVQFEMSSESGEGGRKLHAQGMVTVRNVDEIEFSVGDYSHLMEKYLTKGDEKSKRSDSEVLSAQGIYQLFEGSGISYGPTFQVIDNIKTYQTVDETSVGITSIALLSKPVIHDYHSDEFLMHPSMLDGAFQSCIALEPDSTTLGLPFSIEKIAIRKPLPEAVYVIGTKQPSQSENIKKYTLFLVDENGECCAFVKGFCVVGLEMPATPSHANLGEVEENKKSPLKSSDVLSRDVEASAESVEDVVSEKLIYELGLQLSEQLKVSIEEVDPDSEFSEFGLDSVSLTVFSNELAKIYDVDINPSTLFEFPTVRKLAEYLLEEERDLILSRFPQERSAVSESKVGSDLVHEMHEANSEIKQEPKNEVASALKSVLKRKTKTISVPQFSPGAAEKPYANRDSEHEPIAIIGVSGCFPDSPDLSTFWQNLADGVDCISEIPNSRWNWDEVYGDPKREKNQTNITSAGIMQSITSFDPLFFGISPREAAVMDPQQRLLMTYVWKAIEDSGYAPSSLAGSDTGVFIGTGNSGYGARLTTLGALVESYSAACMVGSVGPNRISHLLDLHGPSEPIETACSSSLVAIHKAVGALRSGRCHLAIVGGVNVLVSPETHISFSKAGMLSEDGRCKTFSKDANGYVRGEGVGMLVLKPLSKAQEDRDHIYALIRGSAENHGGRANSLTAPNPRAQADLIKSAIRDSGVDANTISYVEAHGTGTSLGDPVEIKGLTMAFSELEAEHDVNVSEKFCQLGSVKSNIGHLELAAGVAGILKVLLQMKHKTLVPSLHCSEINPYIDLKNTPFNIVRKRQAWEALTDADGNSIPRRAGVSSFGFGGVNAHIVLEEYQEVVETHSSSEPVAIVISAKSPQSLRNQVRELNHFLTDHSVTLGDLAFTLQTGRDAMNYRMACVVDSVDDLSKKLNAYLGDDVHTEELQRKGIFEGRVTKTLSANGVGAKASLSNSELDQYMVDRDLHGLIHAWVEGKDVDWAKLYRIQPRRISLPTYQFSENHYWIDAVPLVSKKKAPESELEEKTSNMSGVGHALSDTRVVDNESLSDVLKRLSRKEINVDEAVDMVVK